MTKPRTEFPTMAVRDNLYGGRAYHIRSGIELDGSEVQFWETEDRTGHIIRYGDDSTEFVPGDLSRALGHAGFLGIPASAAA